ncbi:hypothetical protein GWK47_032835 [Chionoecetes opilio]|uniref:Uncharacterized protein n=1 Tax=Chionoecetes opilio TaxID=41210 RepID=A0A8J5CPU9_CHIOP|nr:hypothetical protein GWK47_032835 [Chionoecetes opilio]
MPSIGMTRGGGQSFSSSSPVGGPSDLSMGGLDCVQGEAQERRRRERADRDEEGALEDKEKEGHDLVVLYDRLDLVFVLRRRGNRRQRYFNGPVTRNGVKSRWMLQNPRPALLSAGNHLHLGSVQGRGPGGDGDDGSFATAWTGPGESLLSSSIIRQPQNQEWGGHRKSEGNE